MGNQFFEQPILNSPYEYPSRHWELDSDGQPTQRIIEQRRSAQFITPIPKPRKQKGKAQQQQFVLSEGHGLSTEDQRYDKAGRHRKAGCLPKLEGLMVMAVKRLKRRLQLYWKAQWVQVLSLAATLFWHALPNVVP